MSTKEARREARRIKEREAMPPGYKDWVDVAEASKILGITGMAVKNLARKGKIIGHKVKFSTGYVKWLLDPVSVANYVPTRSGSTGFRRYLLRVKEEDADVQELTQYLSDSPLGPPINPLTDEVIWTLEKPKTSKSKSKDTGARHTPKELVAKILGFANDDGDDES